ncbi:hypothetical protein LTR97_008444 [Elasticomyces elasticus]|uniref:Non-haem dioxygenase N-terminal domain-containing protein n=1 Tax=Elasticomyces elasticus TaxID=574655 RepID=A0AAN7W7U0_9PEZI|nr:hypothetical protein LTR97_008444 [Elasticomyces elasticus]
MEIPIIDFARILEARPEIARELATISRTSGWVILTNHSIPDENVQQMMGTAQALLDMPGRERWPRGDSLVGYDNSPTRGIDNAFLAEAFKESCQEILQRLLDCFALAMELPDVPGQHCGSHEQTVQFRVRRYTSYVSKEPPSLMLPRSGSGSIGMVFYSANYTEVDMPNGDWAALPDPHGNVLVYLVSGPKGDVIPFWSRGHLQKMQYRVVESRSDQQGIEKINLAYISTTSPHEMLLH